MNMQGKAALLDAVKRCWASLGSFILIALGVIMLVKVFFLKKDGEKPELGV